jgi:hypothetical protein
MGRMSEQGRGGAQAGRRAQQGEFARRGEAGRPGEPGGPEERFEALVDDLLGIPGVTPPRGGSGFGRNAVRFENKIFVMFVRGRLVVKLPRERVDALVEAGDGVRFDANKGTPMKEWFSLSPESGLPWQPLAREALDYARSSR